MILDHLSNWRQYAALSPRLPAGFAFLGKFDGTTAPGRYEIAGGNVYALVQKYTTKPAEKRQYEAHLQYLDIHFVHSGDEALLWTPLSSLPAPAVPYSPKTDAAMYAATPGGFPVHLGPGLFALVFPGDAHTSSCLWSAPSEVSKVVIKLRI